MASRKPDIPEGYVVPGSDVEAADERARTAKEMGAADGEELPIIVLGTLGDNYFFLDPDGQFRKFTYAQLREHGIASLFGGRIDALKAAFPRRNESGAVIGWNDRLARESLIRRAHRAGLFDPIVRMRGRGTWRASEDGLVVHLGDHLLKFTAGATATRADVERLPAGTVLDDHVYDARPPIAPPAAEPCSQDDCERLLAFLSTWSWEAPREAPRIAFSWIASAMYGEAHDWRPHLHVTGGYGTGKGSFLELGRGLMGGAYFAASNPTAPYVRQKLGGDAVPVFIDEAEGRGGREAANVYQLSTLASSAAQAPTGRWSEHGPVQYPVISCFCFSAVNAPALAPQERSRITVLELGQLVGRAEGAPSFRAELKEKIRLGPGLRRRAYERFQLVRLNQEAYVVAIEEMGLSSRVADQLSTLLACGRALLSDQVIGHAEALAEVTGCVASEVIETEVDEDSQACLMHLLTAEVRVRRSDRDQTFTLAGLVLEAIFDEGMHRALRQYGLAIVEHRVLTDDKGAALKCLVVAHRHQALDRLYRDSPWAGGLWRLPLSRHHAWLDPSRSENGKPMNVSFGGIKGKGTWLAVDELDLSHRDVAAVEEGDT